MDIYYQHWGRESNQLKKKNAVKNNTIKTIRGMWAWFYMNNQPETVTYEECCENLLLSFRLVLPTLFPHAEENMKMVLLKELSETLLPKHTPDDKDLFCSGLDSFVVKNDQLDRGEDTMPFSRMPLEVRFLKNSGLPRDSFLEQEFSADQVRRLDSLLALF